MFAYCVCSGIIVRVRGPSLLHNIDTLNICAKGLTLPGKPNLELQLVVGKPNYELHLVVGINTVRAPRVGVRPGVGVVYAVG